MNSLLFNFATVRNKIISLLNAKTRAEKLFWGRKSGKFVPESRKSGTGSLLFFYSFLY